MPFIAGSYRKQDSYKAFFPTLLKEQSFDFITTEMYAQTIEAMRLLGELNAYTELIPDIDYFIKMHVVKEATTSSKIEGTQTTFINAITPKSEILPEQRDDWQEVQNYITALNFASKELKKLPFSIRLLKDAHRKLLKGARGETKLPGEIRRSQNWIGGSTPSNALYVPPPHTEVSSLLSDLERFWHQKGNQLPTLIKIAIFHYQFESIHPFLDGNGRIGRLAITLQLLEQNILSKSSLYLSAYFESHRNTYYETLTVARTKNDISQLILLFLEGIQKTAKVSIETLRNIVRLRSKYQKRLLQLGRGANSAESLLEYLYTNPIVDTKMVAKALDVSFVSARNIIERLVKLKILKEISGGKRNQLFAMQEYIDIFSNLEF